MTVQPSLRDAARRVVATLSRTSQVPECVMALAAALALEDAELVRLQNRDAKIARLEAEAPVKS